MKAINLQEVQEKIDSLKGQDLYIHLETTNGAYTAYREKALSAGAYIRNSCISFSQGKITGEGPYRVGLKMDLGWIYAEGLTDWEIDDKDRLLLAGHDGQGRLAVALQLSREPF